MACGPEAIGSDHRDDPAENRARDKRAAAIQFLSNHLPVLGCGLASPGEEWRGAASLELPEEIRKPLTRALANAARHLADFFESDPAREVA